MNKSLFGGRGGILNALIVLAILASSIFFFPFSTAYAQDAHIQKSADVQRPQILDPVQNLFTIPPPPCVQEGINSTCYVPLMISQPQCPFPPTADSVQYFEKNDLYANRIGWTYANSLPNPCLTVEYNVSPRANCTYYFYVPQGDASALLKYTLVDLNGVTSQLLILAEAPVAGWVSFLNGAATSTTAKIIFSDNNGQGNAGQKLGWGTSIQHSLWQRCPGVSGGGAGLSRGGASGGAGSVGGGGVGSSAGSSGGGVVAGR